MIPLILQDISGNKECVCDLVTSSIPLLEFLLIKRDGNTETSEARYMQGSHLLS